MERSSARVEESQKRTHLGRCKHFFWLGVVFDAAGASLMFAGVFAHALYCDLLLYGGSIIIFFSLLWWVFWYTGNIELPPEEAIKEGDQRPPAALLNFLGGGHSYRFSFNLGNLSATFLRLRQQRLRPGDFQKSSQSMIVKDQVETQHGKDASERVEASAATPGFYPRPKAEAGGPSRALSSPNPRAGRPRQILPLPPAFSPSQSLPFCRSGSSPSSSAFTPKSGSQLTSTTVGSSSARSASSQIPQIILFPSNRSPVPLPNQPVVTPAPGSQSAFSMSAQPQPPLRQSPLSVTVQSRLQVSPALPIQLQNLTQVDFTQNHCQPHHTSRGQKAATQVSVAPAATTGFSEQIAGAMALHGWPLTSGPISQEVFSPRDPFEQVFIKPGGSETDSFEFPDPATGQPGDKKETS